jgi:hypothetical protein
MCMIISHLVQNIQKAPIYFHRDKLWISPEAWKNGCRTHDVNHWKGVNTEIPKTRPLYSIGYKDQNSENCAQLCPEPHDVYEHKET